VYKKIKKAIRHNLRKLPDKYYLKTAYFLTFFRPLNLKNPKYWTEKIQYKKLYDREIITSDIADKIKVRNYVKDKLGKDIMPEILWIGTNPNDIPFDKLPNEFVVKANHGSGTNLIVKNKMELNTDEVSKQVSDWLSMDYYYLEKEWAYKDIDRKVFVEKLLYTDQGEIPTDIKLYMFHGKLKAINIHYDRFENSHQNILLNETFEPFETEVKKTDHFENIPQPVGFEEMLKYAEELSSELDFIRVDFYDLGDSIALSELTNYPVGGFRRMSKDLDEYLGKQWSIK